VTERLRTAGIDEAQFKVDPIVKTILGRQ